MDFYHHLNNLNRPFGGDDCTSGCCSCGLNEAVGNIYQNHGVGKTFQRPNTVTFLQPFLNFPFASSFKSQGVEMASSFGMPFTSAQWKELERQVLIYRYMLSSVKIPPDLLFPKPTPLDTFSTLYNVRYSKYGDTEPGRCRRTDGKKWRCSKLAAPHQRYCEHHMKRGRSRKLVESKKNGEMNPSKKTRVQQITEPTLLSFKAETNLNEGTERDLFVLDSAKQQWESLVETNMGIGNEGSSVYGYGGPDLNNRDCVNVLPYYSNLDSAPEIEYSTSGFTNAWPSCEYSRSRSLDLSMAIEAADVLDQEMGNIQLEDCNVGSQTRVLDPVWFDPFGPLGEVLHPGSVPDSPYYDSIMSSNPATNVSSPAFERPVFTHSDESVCNSPTLAAILT